ncbi:MAG: photosynthetic reaction center subunit H [Pseudomonadota bacterium]
MTNNVFGSVDLVEILFTLFWLFFAVLVLYLHRESKREGYPLVGEGGGTSVVRGFPAPPDVKTYKLAHGGTVTVPRPVDDYELAAESVAPIPGAPIVPTGDPLVDGVGPAAWSNRQDTPDLTLHGKPRIVPMRTQPGFHVDSRDPDPRGMSVISADGENIGTVTDAWIDIPEPMIVYIEVALNEVAGSGNILIPFAFADLKAASNSIVVDALLAKQFGNAPRLKDADTITLLEEDKVCGYFGGGKLLATPERSEPLI